MEYTPEIVNNINIINQTLNEANLPRLLDNPNFVIDKMSMESWVKINFNSSSNNMPLSLTFTLTGLEIRLDRIAEAIDWSNKDLEGNSIIIKSIIKNIFTNYAVVEYYGRSYTKIKLFASNGTCNHTFKYIEGFYFTEKRTYRLYLPIYTK